MEPDPPNQSGRITTADPGVAIVQETLGFAILPSGAGSRPFPSHRAGFPDPKASGEGAEIAEFVTAVLAVSGGAAPQGQLGKALGIAPQAKQQGKRAGDPE